MHHYRLLTILFMPAFLAAGLIPIGSPSHVQAAGGCRFLSAPSTIPAFCDTFDAPAGTGNRSGDLNGTVWGVSRIISNAAGGEHFHSGTNISQGLSNSFAPVTLAGCGNPTVLPDADAKVCNGQFVEGVNDDDGQTVLAAYPKQPFDIAGRSGTVVFDVSADSQGPHAAWPAFVYTDQPVPAPYSSASGIETSARNSFGFTIAQTCGAGSNCGANCSSTNGVSVDTMYVTRAGRLSLLGFTPLGCVTSTAAPTISLTHFEVHLSATQASVWAANPGGTLIELASTTVAMPLTRGLVWIEDIHYNAGKFNTQQSHTFAWDNVGFDGPQLPRDLTFDVLENTVVSGGARQLGWGNATLTIPGVTNTAQASAALLTMNWWPESTDTITISVNGNAAIVQPWVFNGDTYVWRTIAIPVPISQVHDGVNTVSIKTSDGAAIANVDLVLPGVGSGIVPPPTTTPLPATPTVAATATSIPPTATAVPPTATSTAVLPTATAIPPTATGTAVLPTATPTPLTITGLPCVITMGSRQLTGICSGTFQG